MPNNQHKQQPQGYQPYRFDANQISYNQQILDRLTPTHGSQIIFGKSSLSNNIQKPSYLPLPQQFLSSNINGTQSLKYHSTPTRSPYRSTFSVQSNHMLSNNQNRDLPNHPSQTSGYPISPRSYLPYESPANV